MAVRNNNVTVRRRRRRRRLSPGRPARRAKCGFGRSVVVVVADTKLKILPTSP